MRIEGTIPALFHARVERSLDALAFREYDASTGGFRRCFSWREWREMSLDVAAALVQYGMARGAVLAILAGNTVHWPLAELGGVLSGAVTVGIYPSAAPAQVRELLDDAEVAVVMVESSAQLQTVRNATQGWTRPLLVVADVAPEVLRVAGDTENQVPECGWGEFVAGGRAARMGTGGERVSGILDAREAAVSGDDLAMLVYTSGSTGPPKGARLSHRYVVESACSVRDTLGLTVDDSALSFLPYSHAGERIFGLYTRIACGMTATLVRDVSDIWAAGVAAAPTLFGGMPRFFEKVHEGLQATRRAASVETARRWDAAFETGRTRAGLRAAGEPVPEALDDAWREQRGVIERELQRYVGARLRLATSGGSALPREIAEYLDACGLTVLGAYGQTEHLCATFNRPGRYRHDSVGVAMPGTTVRIAAGGEVQLRRSSLTFSGYHRRLEETREAFTDDGRWLRTGDLGTMDADGFVHITGRLKELVALSNGKKVAPLPLEARLGEGALIAHALVHGEGRPYLVALLTLRWPLVERWQRAQGLDLDAAALVRHPALRADIGREVARVNAEVSRPEQVRRFAILPHELSVEADELTPTHKLRRALVAARYAAVLDALYQEAE